MAVAITDDADLWFGVDHRETLSLSDGCELGEFDPRCLPASL
jgi:hypothetical protein